MKTGNTIKTVHLFRHGGRLIRIFNTGQRDFPFEWTVSNGRQRRKCSPTSYSCVKSAREEALACADWMNDPPKFVRMNDTTNYWKQWRRKCALEKFEAEHGK
jgi:hypothetical protein